MADDDDGPIIDMTPEGEFVTPPKPSLLTTLLRFAVLGGVLVLAVALVWVAVWAALFLLPLLLLGAVIGYFLLKPRFFRF